MDKTKPLLKWVGGKTQIINKLIDEFPSEMTNYHEIFLGGGSVLIALLNQIKQNTIKVTGKIHAYDLNEALIYFYKNVQSNHKDFYYEIQEIIKEFNLCQKDGIINRNPQTKEEAQLSKENYYYWSRSLYNKMSKEDKKSPRGSAMFLFLNKTCFRGVFRVGPNGFNVPYGHYKNPEIINEKHLEYIHELIKDVIFQCCDFETSLENVKKDDYTYLDPPYAPETSTSFVKYTDKGFTIDNHIQLFKMVKKLTEEDKKMMLSNADVSLVRDNFISDEYKITTIICKRKINSKTPQAKVNELIIKNY